MVKASTFKAIKQSSLNVNEKPITSTWTMKKKLNSKYCTRLNVCGYE